MLNGKCKKIVTSFTTKRKVYNVLLVPSIDGPPNQFVPIPVPGVQSKAPLPFCHSQSGIDGTGPKSQKTSSTVTVGGGMVTVGYLANIKLQEFQKPSTMILTWSSAEFFP